MHGFAWDEGKNRINKKRHKLTFEVARLVFEDPFALTAEVYVDENGEPRYQTLGLVNGLLVIIDDVYRLSDGEEKPWNIRERKAVRYAEQISWTTQRKN